MGWKHTFGSILLFLFLLQALTGGVLLLYYSGMPDAAWESLNYIVENLRSVSFARSLHVWGAGLLVIASTLHLLRVAIDGAYKRPRELTWVSGVLLFLLIFAFAFTGYLLPWDQKGYWGTEVGVQMLSKIPWAGSLLAQLLRGGNETGIYTLNRFFALHVFFLPWIVALLIVLHLYLLRRHKAAPHPQPETGDGSTFAFYPCQLFRDSLAVLMVFALAAALAGIAPAGLEARADPSDLSYDPRPEWYFLAHYELLRVFTRFELLPIAIIPSLIILGLLLLPFLDRSGSRYWRERKALVVPVILLFGLMYGAAAYSRLYHPAGGIVADEEELPLPESGDPQVMRRARRVLIDQKCINCHRIGATGGLVGPDLSQAGWKFSPQHLRSQILNPELHNPRSKMPPFEGKISEEDLEAVIAYLGRLF